jgi:uncharacterized GH25 family protein
VTPAPGTVLGTDEGAPIVPLAEVVDLTVNGTSSLFVLRVQTGGYIRGIVVSDVGSAAPAVVEAKASTRGAVMRVHVDDHGRFEFGPVPVGWWELRAVGTESEAMRVASATAHTGDDDVLLLLQ